MMTARNLIEELKERDLDSPIEIEGIGEIIDIEMTNDGIIILKGEQNVR